MAREAHLLRSARLLVADAAGGGGVGAARVAQLEAVPARPDMREKCIPLAIHGDGTPVTGVGKAWSKQYDVWSWCSLLGQLEYLPI